MRIGRTLLSIVIACSGGVAQAQDTATPAPPPAQADGKSIEWNPEQFEGMTVRNGENEVLGKVDDIVEDRTSGERLIVVEYGGVLGLGEKEVLISMSDVDLSKSQGAVVVNLSAAEFESRPDFEEIEEQYDDVEESE